MYGALLGPSWVRVGDCVVVSQGELGCAGHRVYLGWDTLSSIGINHHFTFASSASLLAAKMACSKVGGGMDRRVHRAGQKQYS